MAINVDTVYKTVLLILNQQQRGYMTPDEFNKVGTQVQLSIFETYQDDLNQQYRTPQNDTEYANRVTNIEQKLQPFQKYINNASTTGAVTGNNPFTLNVRVYPADTPGPLNDIYKIGSIIYQGIQLSQYAQRNEITQLLLSPLTQPTTSFPIYLLEAGADATPSNSLLSVYPTTIVTADDINISYLKTPADIKWTYSIGALGQFQYDPNGAGAQGFELSITEQTSVITKILIYAGVIINDPTIIQVASQQINQEEQNSKS
jgi:hypothetical protein